MFGKSWIQAAVRFTSDGVFDAAATSSMRDEFTQEIDNLLTKLEISAPRSDGGPSIQLR